MRKAHFMRTAQAAAAGAQAEKDAGAAATERYGRWQQERQEMKKCLIGIYAHMSLTLMS